MATAGVVYYSRSGNTKAMAEAVYAAIEAEGVEVVLKDVKDTQLEDLLEWDAIVVGSPTYYGLAAAPIKDLFDRSVKYHGKLDGKIGGAFSSSANKGGGNETTALGILEMMLIHGMVVKGRFEGDHYGPVSIGSPTGDVKAQCKALGKEIATLAKKLF